MSDSTVAMQADGEHSKRIHFNQTTHTGANDVSRNQPKRGFFRRLGPGLITGAADDDPSGIATYSQAGAGYGFGLLWTMLLTFPLMVAIQEISARIGRVTGRGIAGNIRRHYSAWLLYPVVFLLVLANTINLGADIGAMGDALRLLIGGPALAYAAGFTVLSVLLEIFISYEQYSKVLKWLTIALFAYVGTLFTVKISWMQAMKGTVLPHFSISGGYWATVIAVFGTTISPYLFFWQASQETEEIRSHAEEQPLKVEPCQAPVQLERIHLDTVVGMAFSSLVGYCIILAAAVTLHAKGMTTVQTSSEAASALAPVAGRCAFFLFAMGIIGTGLLAVPVLAGSAAYGVCEAVKWPVGLGKKPLAAKGFYGVLTVATLVGLAVNVPFVQKVTHLTPMQALFWSAVINGIIAVPIMVVMMLMLHNRKVMGDFARGSRILKTFGWLATAAMFFASLGLVLTWKS